MVVTDVHGPTIALVGPSSVTVECHTDFSDPGVTTDDNCVPKNVTVTTVGLVNINVPNTYTVTYTATDGGGNQASTQRTVFVVDTTAPIVTAPPQVTVYTGAGATSCGAMVSDTLLGAASAIDSCQGSLPTSRVPAGNVFPVGQTTITYTATDAFNNTGTATQNVIVIDNTPPTISCSMNIVVDFDPGVNGAVVTYTPPSGTDHGGGSTTTQTAGLASGSTFPVGTTTNTFRVTDAAGNIAECSFKVTVALTSIIGLDSVSISGTGLVDSYDSIGGYPATKGSIANVLSNGTITLANSGKVAGNVRSTRAGVALS
ncbi:MAG: HYR domain-containing protein, partial [Pyrinomonadaceae bacterium]